ncbi:thermonuclease family protein [Ancylobacter polymorphus]|uniref:Thermonuclease family protein n=1 Tax=Ancylobacter polymorphus TaxID=223390 RepID=A0A9E7CXE8_9HYPH|nr:thermonuclease family protein [Ancylobacter polymorphus]UOK72264.1 thermonuclease family protein [Ancylobacter polymorphus]
MATRTTSRLSDPRVRARVRASLAPWVLAAIGLLVPGAVLAASPPPASVAAPCLPAPLARGHVAEVTATGDLVLHDGSVLRPAGLAGGGAGKAVSWRAALAGRVAGREIAFAAGPARDRYGRRTALIADPVAPVVAPVVAEEPPTVQQALLREGVAVVRPEDAVLACLPAWLAAEAEARRAQRGLWRQLPLAAANIAALRAQQGRFTIVAGYILDVGKTARVDYLNFGRVWRQDMTGRVEAEGQASLAARGLASADLAGRLVRLRGTLFEAGGPAITVRRAEQIELAGDAAHAPRGRGMENGAEGRARPTGDE